MFQFPNLGIELKTIEGFYRVYHYYRVAGVRRGHQIRKLRIHEIFHMREFRQIYFSNLANAVNYRLMKRSSGNKVHGRRHDGHVFSCFL